MYAVYDWHHNQVVAKVAQVERLNRDKAQLNKSDVSLRSQVSQLNQKLQTAESNATSNSRTTIDTTSSTASASSPPSTPTTSKVPTSNLIINDVKAVPVANYWSQAPAGDTYQEVDFTIYNNSSSTHAYSAQLSAGNYIKGVTGTGSVVGSQLPSGTEWLNATILPGGIATGFVLFDLDAPLDTAKLQWQSPDSSEPAYIALPSES